MPPKRKAADDAGAASKVSRRDGVAPDDAPSSGGGTGVDGGSEEAVVQGLSAEQLAEYERRLQEIEKEREQLSDGSHPEIQKRAAVLEKLCQRRIQSAKRLRDLQIENIEGLYDYEMREADAVYQVGVATLKKALSDQLQAKVQKAQEAQQGLASAPVAPSPKSTRGAAAAASGDAASSSASDATASAAAAAAAEPKGNHGGMAPASTRVERQLQGLSARAPFAINETLTDAEVRGDLRRIVEDLNERAKLFAESLGSAGANGSGAGASKARPPGHVFEAAVTMNKTDVPSLTYAGRRFVVGQPVVVHSKLSGQEFAGVIERIQDEDEQEPGGAEASGGEVLAKLADGTFVRVTLSMLQTGRLTLTSSSDAGE